MGFSRQEYWSGVPLPSPSLPYTTVEKTVPPPLNGLGILVKNQLAIMFGFNSWDLRFIPLVLMPVPHCFDYCSFVISLEIRKYEYYALFFFK